MLKLWVLILSPQFKGTCRCMTVWWMFVIYDLHSVSAAFAAAAVIIWQQLNWFAITHSIYISISPGWASPSKGSGRWVCRMGPCWGWPREGRSYSYLRIYMHQQWVFDNRLAAEYRTFYINHISLMSHSGSNHTSVDFSGRNPDQIKYRFSLL